MWGVIYIQIICTAGYAIYYGVYCDCYDEKAYQQQGTKASVEDLSFNVRAAPNQDAFFFCTLCAGSPSGKGRSDGPPICRTALVDYTLGGKQVTDVYNCGQWYYFKGYNLAGEKDKAECCVKNNKDIDDDTKKKEKQCHIGAGGPYKCNWNVDGGRHGDFQ